MKNKVLVAAGVVAALAVFGVSFVVWPPPKASAPEVKDVKARHLTNAELRAELAPVAHRFKGPNVLTVPEGFRCYTSETARFKRVTIVCVQG